MSVMWRSANAIRDEANISCPLFFKQMATGVAILRTSFLNQLSCAAEYDEEISH
jgi:hypothetical protein